jgi:hypothetical protein
MFQLIFCSFRHLSVSFLWQEGYGIDGCVSSSNHTFDVVIENFLSNLFWDRFSEQWCLFYGAFSVDTQRPLPYTFSR